MTVRLTGLFSYMYYIIITYLIGYIIAFVMQRTELAAAGEPYTFGDRLLIAATSLLSWLMVIVVLITAWVKSLGSYWTMPVEKNEPVQDGGIRKVA